MRGNSNGPNASYHAEYSLEQMNGPMEKSVHHYSYNKTN